MNQLRQAIARATTKELRDLARYVREYVEEITEVETASTDEIMNAIEAFGGGAEPNERTK